MKADKTKTLRYLKTARGQIDGVIRMIEDDRYCIDVSNQILAANAILSKANKQIISAHIQCCVKEALENDSDEARKKVDEVLTLLDKCVG